MTDDLTQFASRFKLEAAAALVQIYRDEAAPANARAAAAQQILAHANGRPGIVRPVGVEDISTLDDDQCERLFYALMHRFEARAPVFFKTLMRDAYVEALAVKAALPKPCRFTRGPLAGKGPQVPRWPPAPKQDPALKQPRDAIRGDSSAEVGCPGPAYGETPTPPRSAALIANPPVAADNVVVLPGSGTPYGLRYGLADDLPDGSSNGNGHLPWRRH